jgi:hypothetical protein
MIHTVIHPDSGKGTYRLKDIFEIGSTPSVCDLKPGDFVRRVDSTSIDDIYCIGYTKKLIGRYGVFLMPLNFTNEILTYEHMSQKIDGKYVAAKACEDRFRKVTNVDVSYEINL